MLELACGQSAGHVEFSEFQQGASSWHKVEVPKLAYRNGTWRDLDQPEQLPHRPDAFFALNFPNDAGREPLHFSMRPTGTEPTRRSTTRNSEHTSLFVVKQKPHRQLYGTNRIRAVLTETWTMSGQRGCARQHTTRRLTDRNHRRCSGLPRRDYSPRKQRTPEDREGRPQPAYLRKPEIVFPQIWASPVNNTLHSLLD
jgi:hypothetical protein